MWRSRGDHVAIMWRSRGDHVAVTWQSRGSHVTVIRWVPPTPAWLTGAGTMLLRCRYVNMGSKGFEKLDGAELQAEIEAKVHLKSTCDSNDPCRKYVGGMHEACEVHTRCVPDACTMHS